MSTEISKNSNKDQNRKGQRAEKAYVSSRDRLGDIVWKAAGKFNPKERLQYVMDRLFGKEEIATRTSIMIQTQQLPLAA